jgi:hypothetical protein
LPKLLKIKQAYLGCTSMLFIYVIARFVINLFNYGELVNTQSEMETLTKVFQGIFIAIMVLAGLFQAGFGVVYIVFTFMELFSIWKTDICSFNGIYQFF